MNTSIVSRSAICQLLSTIFALLASASVLFAQGNLTPPAGTPGPTMKTLDQLDAKLEKRTPISSLPFTISSPGSYYVTGNLTGVAGNNGITISANNVTIDLNGFDLAGVSTSGAGIFIGGGVSNVTIHNGTIRNWDAHGVNGAGNSKVRAENLRVFSNGGIGIRVDVNGEVLNCIAESNVGAGIQGADNCLVKDSQAISTTGTQAPGISLGNAAVVTGCVASGNSGHGIIVGNAAVVTGCVARSNNNVGIFVGNSCKIENCTTFNNFDGILGGVVVEVSGCVAASSGAIGIYVGDHALIQNCHVNASANEGIFVNNFSIVRGCTVDFSGSGSGNFYGIYVAGVPGRNRIEANNVTRNYYGIYVVNNGGVNLIIRNSASGSTINYFIPSGNDFGPEGSAATSTSPWANISY